MDYSNGRIYLYIKMPYFVWSSQGNQAVAIIKEARALSNKIITVCHICADCWVKVRTQALHPEGSKEGPSSANSGVKD